ncbi:hypothetical protein GCM10022253_28290 [Sphingomonas endophytica]
MAQTGDDAGNQFVHCITSRPHDPADEKQARALAFDPGACGPTGTVAGHVLASWNGRMRLRAAGSGNGPIERACQIETRAEVGPFDEAAPRSEGAGRTSGSWITSCTRCEPLVPA